MARRIKKTVPFPDWLLNTPCTVFLDAPGLTEDGEKKTEKGGIDTMCMYSERIKRVYTKDGKVTELTGKVIVKGDISPSMEEISGGDIMIRNRRRKIYSTVRAHNPDGTVHHTEFEII